jgi:hypothetical protein
MKTENTTIHMTFFVTGTYENTTPSQLYKLEQSSPAVMLSYIRSEPFQQMALGTMRLGGKVKPSSCRPNIQDTFFSFL